MNELLILSRFIINIDTFIGSKHLFNTIILFLNNYTTFHTHKVENILKLKIDKKNNDKLNT